MNMNVVVPQRAYNKVADAMKGEGLSWSRTFTTEDIERTAVATGDFNPIHFDDAYAAKTRFGRRIMHGASLVGEISRMLGMNFPGRGTIWSDENTSFRRPVYPGDTVDFHAEIGDVFAEKSCLRIATTGTVKGKVVVENTSTIFLAPDPLAT